MEEIVKVNLGIWSPEQKPYELQKFPQSLRKTIYDTDDRVLFGSRYVKGLVFYEFIPGEYMTTTRPYIIGSGIIYNGKGLDAISPDAPKMAYKDLPTMFPDNVFGG
jgi:hypothetical protein